MSPRLALAGLVLLGGAVPAWAQAQAQAPDPSLVTSGWQACAQQTQDATARLACYDRWVQQHGQPAEASATNPATVPSEPGSKTSSSPRPPECRSGPQSTLSRYWELEDGSDCGRFNIRGYRPISLSYIHADTVNRAPSSPAAGHSATSETPYLINEGRIQLSVRTKVGQGFLPVSHFGGRDSLWFGYTQQSYWQLFSGSISRPFRTTDHEPEIMYIVPTPADLPGGWRLRYSGVSLNHQSNGQSLPLSRSWNRAILMAGMEKGERFTVTARLWNRIPDGDEIDDNPDIDKLIGRGEVTGGWQVNKDNTLLLTLRHSMSSPANGSWRFEWLQTLGDANRNGSPSGLRMHLQLFNGYGDSLVDYNRGRTVLSIGLSLVDF